MGFMLPTWFLSMWIANTATTAMMMPVAAAVIGELGNYVTKPEHEMEELTGLPLISPIHTHSHSVTLHVSPEKSSLSISSRDGNLI